MTRKTRRPSHAMRWLAVALLATCGGANASAAAIVADFNDLTPGTPSGQFGGVGFDDATAWGGSGRVSVVAGDLSSPKYTLAQSGDAQSIQGDFSGPRHTTRDLATPLTGQVWFSFLVNLPDSTSRGGVVFNPTATNGTTNPYSVFLLGPEILRATVGESSGNNKDAAVQSTIGETALVVGRLDTEADTLEVWFDPDLVTNPDLESMTPDISEALSVPIESITKAGPMSWNTSSTTSNPAGGALIDHLRLSNSPSGLFDVTGAGPAPVPEPSTLLLVGIGITLLIARRQQ